MIIMLTFDHDLEDLSSRIESDFCMITAHSYRKVDSMMVLLNLPILLKARATLISLEKR